MIPYYEQYIGDAVLTGLWVTPLAVLWLASLFLAPRRKDPARVGVAWLKAAFPVSVLALLCLTIQSSMLAWLDSPDASSSPTITAARAHFFVTGSFFENGADILLLITFVELANGFLLCINNGQPSPKRKLARFAILGWGFVLLVLDIAYFGLFTSYTVTYVERGTPRVLGAQASLTINRLYAALRVLVWIANVPILAAAAYVVHKAKHQEMLRGVARLLLAAAVLNFVRLTVIMAISIDVDFANKVVDRTINTIVEPFFDSVFMFVLLVLLFSLAIRKNKGLWSRLQGEHGWNGAGTENPTVELAVTEKATPELSGAQNLTPELVVTEKATPELAVTQNPTPELADAQKPIPELSTTQKPIPELAATQPPIPELAATQTPIPELPAYLQLEQQRQLQQQQLQQQQLQQQQHLQQQQQGEQMAPIPGHYYYYYPQQSYQQPMPADQQGN